VSAAPERLDHAMRKIAAPVSRVYAAMVDAAAIEQWLPPEGATGTVEALDLRPGGAFRLTLHFAREGVGKTTPDSDVVNGRFVELVPDVRVVQEFDFVSDDPAFAGTMRMTWILMPQGSGTVVTVMAEHVPVGISPANHERGMASSLANLATFVEDRS
jgi:uncharacterized protein YndB with AHSA1/START domain